MAIWEEAPDIKELAAKIITTVDNVAHVDIDQVLFLRELETKPSALARCYRLKDHPIGFFTDKRFVIVLYWQQCDYMTSSQLTLLVLHELMHIPPIGDSLIQHTVKDFRSILKIDLDWAEPGREVPDILR